MKRLTKAEKRLKTNMWLNTKIISVSLSVLALIGTVNSVQAQDLSTEGQTAQAPAAAVTVDFNDTDILEAIDVIAQQGGWKIDVDPAMTGKISLRLKDVPVMDAFRIVLEMSALAYSEKDGVYSIVTSHEFEQINGRKFDEEIRVKFLTLAHIDPAEALAVLQEVQPTLGRVYLRENYNDLILMGSPAEVETLTKTIKEADVQRFKMVFELTYAKAPQLSELIKPLLTKNTGRIKMDEASNKIVVTDTSVKIEEIRKLVDAQDHRDRQVQIEAKIIRIVLNDEHSTGVDWEAIVSDYQHVDLADTATENSSKDQKAKLSVGCIANDDYSILIEALDTVGKVEVLSQPDIVTTNNKEAKFLLGTLQPYAAPEPNASKADNAGSEKLGPNDFGMKLFVTPNVHPDGDTTLRIRPEISSFSNNSTGSNKPVKQILEAQATVRVKNGVTVVIGGLLKEERSNITKKVPVLGDVPFLGQAFRSSRHDVQETEIVIFLKPKISSADIGTPVQAKK